MVPITATGPGPFGSQHPTRPRGRIVVEFARGKGLAPGPPAVARLHTLRATSGISHGGALRSPATLPRASPSVYTTSDHRSRPPESRRKEEPHWTPG